MQTSKVGILLLGESKQKSKFLIEILERQDFRVIFADHMDVALQKIRNESPQLIVSSNHIDDFNGFQIFNFFSKELSRCKIPFVLVFDGFRKNELMTGIELGIDSFIFPPYDSERILNIVRRQLIKNSDGKVEATFKLNTDGSKPGCGVFVADNRKVVESNVVFDKLLKKKSKPNGVLQLNDIFSIVPGSKNKSKLSKILNGRSNHCVLNEVRIKGKKGSRYDIYLLALKKNEATTRVVGLVVTAKETEEASLWFIPMDAGQQKKIDLVDTDQITLRERQILQLSATGCTIKQIADRLGISIRTVEKHRSNIIRKMRTENIMEAVFLYEKNYLLSI